MREELGIIGVERTRMEGRAVWHCGVLYGMGGCCGEGMYGAVRGWRGRSGGGDSWL